jgi:hypothetical protein
MAPEIFENKDYTIKADVYSFAVKPDILYRVLIQ